MGSKNWMPESLSGPGELETPAAHCAPNAPPKRTDIQPGLKLELDLTPAERKAILDERLSLPPEYAAMLNKKIHLEQPLLLTLDELEDFSGYVAAVANDTSNRNPEALSTPHSRDWRPCLPPTRTKSWP
jgi:hypothetical protein